MSTRPKPRPRPRPKQPAASSTDTVPTASASQSEATQSLSNASQPFFDDDDDLFIKNRGDSWKKLEKLEQATNEGAQKRQSSDESDDDSGVEVDSPSRKRHKANKAARKEKKQEKADWTKHPNAIIISDDEDDDDDEDGIFKDVENVSASNRPLGSSRTQNKARSRSRSLTPPPALPAASIEHARTLVKQLFDIDGLRSHSPEFEIAEDSVDNIELDPELARIARKAELEVMRQSSTPAPGARSPSPEIGGPEKVAIKVRWRPHPLNANAKPVVMGFTVRRNDPFRIVFDACADEVSVPVNNLIISYEGKRIYPSASPHGIGVWAEAELEACDKITHEYLRTHRESTPGLDDYIRGGSLGRTQSPPASSQDEQLEEVEEQDEDDSIKLVFRSAAAKDISLKVRQSAKCRAILNAYLKKAGLAEKYAGSPKKKRGKAAAAGPALAVDGDRLNPDDEISVADLEDGDMVEVVGL